MQLLIFLYTALVEYDPMVTSLEKLKEALATIGYDMVIEPDNNVETLEAPGLCVASAQDGGVVAVGTAHDGCVNGMD